MSLNSSFTPEKAKYLVNLLKNRSESIVSVKPLNKSDFSAGENMKYRVTGNGYWDVANSYFTCQVVQTGANATDKARMTPNSESWFKKMVITFESTGAEAENFDHRDVLSNFLIKHTVGVDSTNSERALSNMANSEVKVTADGGNTANHGYKSVNSHIGFLGSQKLIPLKYCGSVLFDIDLQTDNVLNEIIDTAGTAAIAGTVVFNDWEYHMAIVNYGEDFDAVIQEQINSPEGLNILYDTYHHHVDNSTASSFTSKMNVSSNSVKGVYTTMRRSDMVNVTYPTGAIVEADNIRAGHNYQFTSENVINGVGRYNYVINNKQYPSYNAKVGVDSYNQLLTSLGRLNDVSTGSLVTKMTRADTDSAQPWAIFKADAATATPDLSYLGAGGNATTTTGAFGLGVNLEELGESSQLQSGMSTKGNLDLELNYTRAGTEALTINHFVHVDRMLNIRPNREVSIIS